MEKKLVDLLLIASKKLEKLHFKFSIKNSVELDYSSLSPIANGDKEGHYSKALLWALENREEEDIKNIALTGTYGSGKSTILKTFQKNYKGTEFKFLNISLATFKEEKTKKDDEGNPIIKDKEDLLRLIETSILQQIFYHEEDKNIPDSRFKKIKSYSRKRLLFTSVGILVFIIAILNYFNSYLVQSIFKDHPLSIFTCNTLHYSSILIIIIGVFFLVYKSIRVISSMTINKLQFQNAEIGIGESINKSILNHHLDEILYFFSIRPYNIVIIEDLDRFEETEIFTKLREINLLLNNSEKTKKKNITFIYAVRDDMFSDNERIKFFDFIIPVIPVINSSNSSEILLRKKEKYNYDLTHTFIEDISFFIDDMRLLHNISNEFYLYKVKQGETPLNQDKLFAIITYKNKYPNDFVSLGKNEGHLYNILNSKSKYVNQEVNQIDEKTSVLKEEIKNLELVNIKSIKELRQLYIIRVIETLDNFNSLVLNKETITIDDLLKDENFEYLKSNKLFYQSSYHNRGSNRTEYPIKKVEISFSEIEKKVDSKKSYTDKEQEIIDIKSNKSHSLRQEIQKLEKQKNITRNLNISELVQSNKKIDLNINEDLDTDFITTLIRNGYISEDYIDYISLFHEGSITRNDHKFIINVRNKQKIEFDYKLSKIDKVISKINPIDFDSEFILNYDLLDFLLKNHKTNNIPLEYIFTKLKDESSTSTLFINGFIERTENLNVFIKTICSYWIGIWGYYLNDVTYSDEQLNKILKYIIEFADIESIIKIDKQSNLKNHLTKDPEILNITSNNDKLINIISDLELKFIDLDFENSPENILDFIYENNHYEINEKMVNKIVKKYGEFEQVSFDNSNYSSIKGSKSNSLISYIETYIDDYVRNIYLKLDTNINEEQKSYIELLNHSNLSLKLKLDVIKKVATKISDISTIEEANLLPYIIENNKIETKWENLLFFFKESENKILESSIDFINNIENANELAKVKMPTKVNDENIFGVFSKALMQSNKINNESFDLITNSIPFCYSDLDIANLDEEKVHSLINNRVISPTIKSFESLKENHDKLNIILLEKHKAKFIELIGELVLDVNDVELILKSAVLNNLEKLKFLETCSNETISSNSENLKLISQLILNDSSFGINELLLKNLIIDKSVPVANRIKLFNKNLFTVDQTFIGEFLKNLDSNYEKISNRDRKAKIQDNPDNRELLINLQREEYISSFSEGLFGLRVNHKRI
ncbi:YobI family P-loop NTPase [Flavobacterium frigidarium]|uniref:YobI-like P-loop NTPase domain-containing protein n=1 Tax=Flavobacterium frigidarium TaxID=99286 RepID=A0ABV4KE11_9FLAO